jgi:small conductance mechanosensitive channel
MNAESLPNLGFDWNEAWIMVKTTGVDFVINVIVAILIFYIGKWVVNLIVEGMLKAMRKGDMDQTLRRFVANLARMLLMLFVIIAAINQLGIQTASLIALVGSAWLCRVRSQTLRPES